MLFGTGIGFLIRGQINESSTKYFLFGTALLSLLYFGDRKLVNTKIFSAKRPRLIGLLSSFIFCFSYFIYVYY